MKAFYVYEPNAYVSEIDLFRAERVPAEECEVVMAPDDTSQLYRVERDDLTDITTHDWKAARDAFMESARHDQYARLVQINVIR